MRIRPCLPGCKCSKCRPNGAYSVDTMRRLARSDEAVSRMDPVLRAHLGLPQETAKEREERIVAELREQRIAARRLEREMELRTRAQRIKDGDQQGTGQAVPLPRPPRLSPSVAQN
jgi:hypothetical protein